MDGAGHLTHPIPPGGSFVYDFVVPDAGTFWFHPHVRADLQVERGLYGVIVVRDDADEKIQVARDLVIALDDVLVDPVTGALDLDRSARAAMMGREGNLVLLNGKPANAVVAARSGERLRLRLVNVANSRYFRLSLQDGRLVQIGGDGGLLASPRPLTEGLLLVPGERADLVMEAPSPESSATLRATAYERARGAGATEVVDLLRIDAGAEPVVTTMPTPANLREVPASSPVAAVERRLTLGERMGHHDWEFTINDRVFPAVPAIEGSQGTRQRWAIENKTDMDHPFHLHGFFFQAAGAPPEWKDTINVPARKTIGRVTNRVRELAQRLRAPRRSGARRALPAAAGRHLTLARGLLPTHGGHGHPGGHQHDDGRHQREGTRPYPSHRGPARGRHPDDRGGPPLRGRVAAARIRAGCAGASRQDRVAVARRDRRDQRHCDREARGSQAEDRRAG